MPTPRLLLLLALTLLALTGLAAHSVAAPQVPDVDVDLPPLPKADETAKFKLTVSGQQSVGVAYTFQVPGGECPLESEAKIDEGWHFERGKAVVIEFRRYGDNVFISRQGRQIGDLAFGTVGTVERNASGSVTDCRGTFPLNRSPVCGQDFKVSRNLRLSYQNQTITVEPSDGRALPKNPAEACSTDTDVISPEYPSLIKAKAALKTARVFGAKKGIALTLQGRSIKPFPPAYTTITHYHGESHLELTLTRIKPKQ